MSAISKQALVVDNSQSFPNNNAGAITPTALRNFNTNMIDSNVNQTEYNTNSGSWNVSISNLNTFTASQQPSFTALNSFTASQLTINTGYNSFTQSTNVSINSLTAEVDTLQTWTGSVNAISDNGVLQGYSTRLNFYGLMTASIVANVGGPIAAIGLLSDTTRVSTSSFNAYTASIAGTNAFTASTNSRLTNIESTTASLNNSVTSLNAFTASANTSINQLLSFSSSLDATYATDAQLNASASTLQANINTKLNTSSFNAYTASQTGTNQFTSSINSYTASNDTKWTTIGLLTGSYATTGSNTFIGNQIIIGSTIMTGSLTITGSAYGNVLSASIVSSTASIDLSKANYFTLLIASNTKIDVTNPQPGVTATLVINTAGATTASFSSNVKQSSGSVYVPSNSGSIDILSFTAVTTSSVYVIPAYSFV